MKNTIETGSEIFAGSPATDEMTQQAREFIKEKGLTADDVKIVKRGDAIAVISKKELNY